LHDVGKLSVPDVVLTKAGPLTEGEWELMRQHPESGRSILADIPFLAGAREIVHAHHERWDGTGYPRGLAGEEIPLGAQIFPLCDAFDAMTSDRPYRKALFTETALGEIRRGAGTQFRPDAVEAFLSLPLDELEVVRDDMRARSS
jgi:HD-GYP domain-containing protein (c-di-GMP phosphodiesterase class II)